MRSEKVYLSEFHGGWRVTSLLGSDVIMMIPPHCLLLEPYKPQDLEQDPSNLIHYVLES